MAKGRGVRRRGFLAGALLLLIAGAAGLWRRLFGAAEPPPAPAPDPERLIPTADLPLFLSVADVIVPRFESHPAASEIDFLPSFERQVARDPRHERFLRRAWPRLQAELRRRVPVSDGRIDEAGAGPTFEAWYREYRESPKPSLEARGFELLRYHVLRTYYASQAGWAFVGYTGPVHRRHPLGRAAP